MTSVQTVCLRCALPSEDFVAVGIIFTGILPPVGTIHVILGGEAEPAELLDAWSAAYPVATERVDSTPLR
jgi:hypothetical protein